MASTSARFSTESSLKGLPAMQILDQAVSLLRHAPLATLSVYFLGALPFCLGLIYFWFDMIQSANAETRMPGEALALTALYFWMKTCQAVFARKLLAFLEGDDAEPWTAQRWGHTALLQIIYAGSQVVVYPLALLMTLPFGWTNAFYHTISIVGTGSRSTLGSTLREAMEMARLWPKQNHLLMGAVLLALFLLFLNLAVFFFSIPQLLNSLFGIETVFNENAFAWNNSSFYLSVSVFCFLILNPLNKAIYVLRCFYGRSRLSGTDLKAELRRFRVSRQAAASARGAILAAVLALFAAGGTARADAAPAPAPPVSQAADPATVNLDHAIQRTLQKDEFAWRAPREKAAEKEDNGFFARMARLFWKWLKGAMHAAFKMLGKFFKWLFGGSHDHEMTGNPFAGFAAIPWRVILVLLAIILIVILSYVLMGRFRRRQRPAPGLLKPLEMRTVDLEAENVQADELPEDSWLALAQQLIERGELRLAVRAFYLATLSALARRELVRLAAAKSNRDYIVELTRRGRGENSVVPLFRENVRLFEASWYGTHAVTSAMIETMRANQQQVGSHAAT